MKSYWAFVRHVPGSFIRVVVQAQSAYAANEMLKAQYGSKLVGFPVEVQGQ